MSSQLTNTDQAPLASAKPTRRTLLSVGAWAVPVLAASTALPAYASSALSTGIIQINDSGDLALGDDAIHIVTGFVMLQAGNTLPTTVTISYNGVSVSGPSSAPVDASGNFSFTVTAGNVSSATKVTVSAQNFASASQLFTVLVATNGDFRFVPVSSDPKNVQPDWVLANSTVNGNKVTDWYRLQTYKTTSRTAPKSTYIINLTGALLTKGGLDTTSPIWRSFAGSIQQNYTVGAFVSAVSVTKNDPFMNNTTIKNIPSDVGIFPSAGWRMTNYNASAFYPVVANATATITMTFNNLPNYSVFLTIGV